MVYVCRSAAVTFNLVELYIWCDVLPKIAHDHQPAMAHYVYANCHFVMPYIEFALTVLLLYHAA